ncbi:MAG TPA: hypothetical protein VM598_14045 [Bdellovibrionota bacterium]|nr:hypothetical protein [Bdellovibrionota bacterium]
MTVPAFAADTFEYPELLVAPRASERLEMEARAESESRWSRFAPIQVSALATLLTGITQSGGVDLRNDPSKRSPIAGYAVGGGWLAATLILSATYRPYESGSAEVKGLPKGSPREQLVRERMAEEAIERAASLGKRLKWVSAATNLGANLYMVSNSEGGTFAKTSGAVAMALSLTPLIFPSRWELIACEQREYKKKIYAPIASLGTLVEPVTLKPAPGLSLSFSF